jgi:hypothetical protein
LGLAVSFFLGSASTRAEIGELKSTSIAFRTDLDAVVHGPTVMVAFSEYFTATAGYCWLNFDSGASTADIHYQGRLSNMQAFVNWHPFAGSWHFSAGAFVSSNKVTVSGKPLRNAFFDAAGTGDTSVQVGSFSSDVELPGNVDPYLGFGWATQPLKGEIGFFANFGVIFTSTSNSSAMTTGAFSTARSFPANPGNAGNVMSREIKPRHFAPLAQIGLGYRF